MKNSRRALRVSIVMQWVLIVTAVVIGFYEEGNLPEALRRYIIEQDNKPISLTEMIVLGSSALLLIGLMISSVGIYRLKSWSRTPYVICSVLITFVFLFLGPVVTPPIEGTFQYLANAIEGFAIALMYFSSVRESFECSTSNNSEISNQADTPDPEPVR
jgi:magnesium-transporting ATPase (P-type)